VPRRVSLPGAEEFFRPTQGAASSRATPEETSGTSGRVRHDEKITIYLSGAELLELEQARLSLRAQYGAAADRGRVVREAIAITLADLAENGENSQLVKRLKG